MKITDTNYYTVHGWMITRLGLKGVDLSVYAIIYGFTQDGETEFRGSAQYLCDFCGGVTRPTVLNALKRLTESGLLLKQTENVNGVTFARYKVDLNPIKDFYGDVKYFNGGCKNILQGGSKKFLHNNKDIDKEIDINNNNISADFEKAWQLYPRKEGKKEAEAAYLRARKKGTAAEEVEQGIRAYNAYLQRERTPPKYIKQGSTYFRGECWNDDYGVTPRKDTSDLDAIF